MKKNLVVAIALLVVGASCAQLRSRIKITADKITIAEKIQFETGKATILPASHSLLNELAQVFRDNPQIERVRIEGHTDSTGKATSNKRLSNDRAEAVLYYLVEHGVESRRLQAKGFGQDSPIASNDTDTDAGRAQNRRVEFNIVKQKATGYTGAVQ